MISGECPSYDELAIKKMTVAVLGRSDASASMLLSQLVQPKHQAAKEGKG